MPTMSATFRRKLVDSAMFHPLIRSRIVHADVSRVNQNTAQLAAMSPEIVTAFNAVEFKTPPDHVLAAVCPEIFKIHNLKLSVADLNLYPDLLRDVKFLYVTRLYKKYGKYDAIAKYLEVSNGGRPSSPLSSLNLG